MRKSKTLIKQEILSSLKKSNLRAGDKLPSERVLTQELGVSRATLREVLNSLVDGGILIRRQGAGTFVNNLASNGENKIIGVMIPGLRDYETIFTEIIHHMEKHIAEKGYTMMLCNHDNTFSKAELYVNQLASLNIAGLALVPIMLENSEEKNLEIVKKLENIGLSFLLFDSQISARTQGRYSYVGTDNYHAMRQMVMHLASQGHKRIAYIKGFDNVYSSQQRFDGFIDGMCEAGLDLPESYIESIKHNDINHNNINHQGRAEIRNLLKLKNPPTAVSCIHDVVAYNVIDELRSMGLKVPADIAITGFDNIDIKNGMYNTLTTVNQPAEKEAEHIVNLLIDKIEGRVLGERQENLHCELIIRSSCKKLSARQLSAVAV